MTTSREQELEDLLRSVFLGSAAGMTITTPDGRYLRANPAYCDILGWSEEELIGRSFYEHTHPDDLARNADAVARLIAGDQDRFVLEKRNRTRSGDTVHVRTTVSLVRSPSGEPRHLIGIVEDVTAARRSEDRLRRSTALLRIAGTVARVGGFAIELPERRVIWSDEVAALLGAAGALPSTIDETVARYSPSEAGIIIDAVERCARSGAPFDLEVPARTADGERIWVRVAGEAERDRTGTVVRIVGAVQDVTQRRRMEQQFLRAQRMESIGTLASGIAHDLNNVLAPILMAIELLQVDEHDPTKRTMLGTLATSARRGADMVRQVLTFARGVEGVHDDVHVDLLLDDVLRMVVDTFPKDIRITSQIETDLWPLRGDATQLHQVLINLCVNARDAMPDGGSLVVTARNAVLDATDAQRIPRATPGRYVVLEVTDSGTGMQRSVIEKIFDPFFTTKEIGKGTGLGLPTSLAIVRSHRGVIDVDSAPGRGTTVSVFLPIAAAPAPVELDPSGAMPIPRGRGELILVVDDEDALRDVTRSTLDAFGYRTLAAVDGTDAVRLFREHHDDVDLVITDMMMPLMDGPTTIRELHAVRPGVPIIAVTGLDVGERTAAARAAGVDHVLAKPYTAEALLLVIQRALAGTVGTPRTPESQ